MTAPVSRWEVSPPVIDERAVVHPDAELAPGCRVGPLAVVGAGVSLGAGTIVYPHGVVEGPSILGPENRIHPFACIGGPPQDRRHRDEPTELIVGKGNVFREHVTVNRGTVHGGGKTVIGDHNLFMAYAHIAHDCRVGDHTVFANHATVAGHTIVQDHAVFGGMAAVGAFLRVGESAMIAAGAMTEREVPPFCIVAGARARLRALNRVGIGRRSLDDQSRQEIKQIFKQLMLPGLPLHEIVESMGPRVTTPPAYRMLRFLETVSKGITR